MKLVVGLGNPGRQYEGTRHNVGYVVMDRLVQRHAAGAPAKAKFQSAAIEAQIGSEKCLLIKPNTYMNLSGRAVGEAVRFHKLHPASDVIVVVDDVALPVGALRVRPQGGAGGHNGLADIQRALGGTAYPRVRIGIGASPSYMDQADYVLGKFTDLERPLVDGAIEKAADAVEVFVNEGVDAAMNRFNAPDEPDGPTHPGWLSGANEEEAPNASKEDR